MNSNIRIAAYLATALTLSMQAWAQSGEMSKPKTIAENDKMIVTETIGKPGETTPSINRLGQLYITISRAAAWN